MQNIPQPQQHISQHAVKVWRISNLISNGIILIVLAGILFLQKYFDWYDWIGPVLYSIIALVFLYGVYEVVIKPIYLQKTWRYEIDEQHVQIKHGLFSRHHLIVPMTKVEYVNTNQGPLLRRYGLSTITIGTIASSHEIPTIPEAEAKELRNKIAFLANINDTDV